MNRCHAGLCALLLLAACGAEDPVREVRPLEVPDASAEETRTLLRDARALIEDGDESEALALLERALVLRPGEPEAHYLQGLARFENGRYGLAIPPLERSLELRPDDVRARARLAEALLVVGRYDASRDVYRAWVRDMPENFEARVGLARVQYRTGRFPAAVKHFTKAVQIKGRNAEIRSDLGLAHQALGQYAEAEARQLEAIDADRNYVEAWFRLATVIAAQGPARTAEALGALAKAAELAPNHFLVRVYAYWLHRMAGDDTEGGRAARRSAWQEVLRVVARSRRGHLGLDASEEAFREDVETEEVLRQAVAAAGRDAAPHRRLALYLHRCGRFEEAVAAYEIAVPLERTAATLAAWGAALLEIEDGARAAETTLRSALELDPDLPAAWANLAYLALREGRDADAAAAYERVLAVRPDDRRARTGRALAWLHGDRAADGLAELLALGGS